MSYNIEERSDILNIWISSNALDVCVLALLKEEDTYGYIVTQTLKKELEVSESTLYPVLRRLEKNAFLGTYDKPFQGRNRRYYTITKKGEDELIAMKKLWNDYKEHIDNVLGGKKHE